MTHAFEAAAPIELLTADAARAGLADLGDVLRACVEGGGGVGFVLPFSQAEAETFWASKLEGVERHERYLLVARLDGRIVATVMLELAQQPNGLHRAEVAKLMVHPDARGRGLSRKLLEALEALARSLGRSLLVLDTSTGELAETIYPRCGYEKVGVIPGYALFPDGRMGATTVFCKQL
ncbi:GNAT family N-acetyltransferase [Roseibium sp.]|uniref:GNAT family N-acetyltransferase n=1 Tax=Roseibium sp. TaxID=1936156 RepID=UPI003A97E70A